MDHPAKAVDANERAGLERLRRENAELRMDRQFLKRAAALVAKLTRDNGDLPDRIPG